MMVIPRLPRGPGSQMTPDGFMLEFPVVEHAPYHRCSEHNDVGAGGGVVPVFWTGCPEGCKMLIFVWQDGLVRGFITEYKVP